MNQMTDVVKHLLIINVLMFILTTTLSSELYDFIGANGLGRNFLALFFPMSEQFRPFQIVTHMFMHGGISHLAFNMMSLYFLGTFLERYIGAKWFLLLYLVSGFGAMLLHIGIDAWQYAGLAAEAGQESLNLVLQEGHQVIQQSKNYSDPALGALNSILNVPMLGASGAVYGVLIAFATLFPDLKLMLLIPPMPVKARYLAIGLIAFDLFMGFSSYSIGVAHFAHLGGALTGFLMIKYWQIKGLS